MLTEHLIVVALAASVAFGRPTVFGVLNAVQSLSDDELTALEVMLGMTGGVDDDEEEMQGDQPYPGNETSLDPIKSSVDVIGGRDREQRIKMIMQQVLQFAGRDMKTSNTSMDNTNTYLKPPKNLDREFFDEVKKMQYNSTIFTEKVQNCYPACQIPRNTDEEMWESGQAMKLNFELHFPTPSSGNSIQIQSAKLRLYKISQPPPSEEKREPEDRKIRVTAYWYTRSLKRLRVKRKLLDSMMLPLYSDEATELNVKPAVNSWKETGKNFGLAVEVENEDGVLLQASKYFVMMNCSKDAAPSRSMPLFLMDAIQNRTAARAVGVHHYPSLEISTIEFPPSPEGTYRVVKYSNDSVHRLRHNHNHHQAVSTTPANDSVEQIQWDDPTKG
ncbi:hypothetical protein GE061_014159 [Apolygus lucorum]|uniref:TGF-beta propeptide domain-containing protein n=1 Tax=Apolygus lucorum TaxID=248454 RepID=A0A8S9XSI9_APOLU|nr:hypothetical protein GE061_014159 [Apolygus lucorum]